MQRTQEKLKTQMCIEYSSQRASSINWLSILTDQKVCNQYAESKYVLRNEAEMPGFAIIK